MVSFVWQSGTLFRDCIPIGASAMISIYGRSVVRRRKKVSLSRRALSCRLYGDELSCRGWPSVTLPWWAGVLSWWGFGLSCQQEVHVTVMGCQCQSRRIKVSRVYCFQKNIAQYACCIRLVSFTGPILHITYNQRALQYTLGDVMLFYG
jgi:hypothetical protein